MKREWNEVPFLDVSSDKENLLSGVMDIRLHWMLHIFEWRLDVGWVYLRLEEEKMLEKTRVVIEWRSRQFQSFFSFAVNRVIRDRLLIHLHSLLKSCMTTRKFFLQMMKMSHPPHLLGFLSLSLSLIIPSPIHSFFFHKTIWVCGLCHLFHIYLFH
jgi:hypothetical protein